MCDLQGSYSRGDPKPDHCQSEFYDRNFDFQVESTVLCFLVIKYYVTSCTKYVSTTGRTVHSMNTTLMSIMNACKSVRTTVKTVNLYAATKV